MTIREAVEFYNATHCRMNDISALCEKIKDSPYMDVDGKQVTLLDSRTMGKIINALKTLERMYLKDLDTEFKAEDNLNRIS